MSYADLLGTLYLFLLKTLEYKYVEKNKNY